MPDIIIHLRQQGERCRRLSTTSDDDKTALSLRLMAEDYLARAKQREAELATPLEL